MGHQPTPTSPCSWSRDHIAESRIGRNYLALLVPAIAKVHADYPQKSGQENVERAIAIRRAADVCLVQALSSINRIDQSVMASAALINGRRHIARPAKRCNLISTQQSSRSALKLKASIAPQQIASCRQVNLFPLNRHGILRRRSRRIKSVKLHFSQRIRMKARRRPSTGGGATAGISQNGMIQVTQKKRLDQVDDDDACLVNEEEEAAIWIPDENELTRLHSVMFSPNNTRACTAAASRGGGRRCSTSNNAVALLSQAAHYIRALQVQVGALQSLDAVLSHVQHD